MGFLSNEIGLEVAFHLQAVAFLLTSRSRSTGHSPLRGRSARAGHAAVTPVPPVVELPPLLRGQHPNDPVMPVPANLIPPAGPLLLIEMPIPHRLIVPSLGFAAYRSYASLLLQSKPNPRNADGDTVAAIPGSRSGIATVVPGRSPRLSPSLIAGGTTAPAVGCSSLIGTGIRREREDGDHRGREGETCSFHSDQAPFIASVVHPMLSLPIPPRTEEIPRRA
jgi:hypothetical protein